MTHHPRSIDSGPPNPIRVPAGEHRWDEYWAVIGNEEWLLARQLLDLSPRVRRFFASHLIEESVPAYDGAGGPAGTEAELVLDWHAAAQNVRQEGLSSTERRLADLVLALALDNPVVLSDLALMNTWLIPVWTALVEWASNGAATVKASW